MKNKKITIDDLAVMMKKGFDGVDEKFDGVDEKFDGVDEKISTLATKVDLVDLATKIDLINLEAKIDKKFKAMEERWSYKFDKLTTTLDKFLKRMTDMEDEFTLMKHDLNRMKKVIKEKLGVEL